MITRRDDVIKRLKQLWLITWLCVTGIAFLVWDFKAAIATAVGFAGAGLLAFVAFILNLLLGDTHFLFRMLLIVAFIVGLIVEIYVIVSVFEFAASIFE